MPATTEPGGEDSPAWHALSTEEALEAVDSRSAGLSTEEARHRLERHGKNELREEAGTTWHRLLLAQFRDPLVYLLAVAFVLSLGVGFLPGGEPNYVEAGFIALIVLANGLFGFVQDYQATRAIEALRDLASPDATVCRDGDREVVDATAVVPGDVIALGEGDAVPADARVLESHGLRTDEAPLTGESAPVSKATDPLDAETPLAERQNVLYKGTAVVSGRGLAVVVETGMDTAVGDIATELEGPRRGDSPFEEQVERLGRQLGAIVVGLIVLTVGVQFLFTATDPVTILLIGITLAVAGVPEGLPAVVTFTLALGAREMVDRNAIVRRLPVVESLGSVDVILTDKTGTLTEEEMTVARLWAGDTDHEVPAADGGETSADSGDVVVPEEDPALEGLIRCGGACTAVERAADGTYDGDPTEVAIRRFADESGVDLPEDVVREIQFTSERKRMTVVCGGDPPVAYVKGAPETILERCDREALDGTEQDLTEERRETLRERASELASDGLRVLAFATGTVPDPDADPDAVESDLCFLGFQGLRDPPRPEVADAIADCKHAGVRPIMATGDTLETAVAIAEAVGIDPGGAMTGAEVADQSDEELRETVESVDVFARVEPAQKARLLQALQANGHTVAVTGDGVNDAPALSQADVGVAMGQRGTDVARQAADVVLRDDNFATIRDAIEQGRGIFENVRKFVNYLVSTNTGEVLVVFLGVLVAQLAFPGLFDGSTEALVLTPILILWINVIADTLPALALGADPSAAGLMDRPPRPPDEGVINRRVLASIISIATLLAVVGVALFVYGLDRTGSIRHAQTLLFTFVIVGELVRIQIVRSRYGLSPWSNPWLIGAVSLSLGLHLAVLYTPLAGFFGVVPLTLGEWGWVGVAFVAFLVANLLAATALDRLYPRHGTDVA
jgi:Ca2+-transporting ATPase